MIIDACYATNAGLPFSLNEEMDSKSNDPYGVFKLLPGTSYLEPEIILITSSHPNSKSIVTEHGSLMTQAIYNYLVQAETARHQLSVSIERITTSVAELEERFEAPGGKDKRFDQKVLDWEIERHKRMLSEKMSQYSLGNTLLSLIHAVRYYINKVAYRNIDLWKREIVPTIAIYSTYPNLTHIWSWIYCPARTITKYTGSKQNIELHLLDK